MDDKKTLAGIDENGTIFGIEIPEGEEVSEETFKELSNGRGDDE